MEVTRTFDLLDRYADKYTGKTDVFAAKVDGRWITYDVNDYIDNAHYISYGLLAFGLQKDDRVATISNNRPEWNFTDMGLALARIIHVPIFSTLNKQGYKEIFDHAGVKAVFVSDVKLYNMLKPVSPDLIFTFDKVEGARHWTEVLDMGKGNAEQFKEQITANKVQTLPTDPVTLIYTSGTTGSPKGVLLSHQNLVTNAIAAAGIFKLKPDQRYLSILPLCHVGERMANYQTQYSGSSIYYAESISTLARDLKDVGPHGFGAVPRVLEKVFDKIVEQGHKLTGVKKKLFFWALNLGLNYKHGGANGLWYEMQLKLANKLIFSKWRDAIGGNVISVGVGGAALQPRLERVFWAADIRLLNMYGLTETSPIITINRDHTPDLRLGSVGKVIKDVEIKIAGDGEILCRGPNVMLGYYKNEKATREAIDSEGWFHTGDIGMLDEENFLHIKDRKKELFKLSNGKFVSPLTIESLFKESQLIDQVMIIGDGKKFTSALISPNFDVLKAWCEEKKIGFTGNEDIINKPEVNKLFNSLVENFNPLLSKDEQVKRFRIVADEWSPNSNELSPTLKLKRKQVEEKYKRLIDEIYKKDSIQVVAG